MPEETKLIDWLLQGGALALLGVVLFYVNKHMAKLGDRHHEQHLATLKAFATHNAEMVESFERRNGELAKAIAAQTDRLEHKHDETIRLVTNGHREAMRQAASEVIIQAMRHACPMARREHEGESK